MDDPTLATRPGLPDALRVLVERYPREGWEAHPAFDGLTRFWLDRHLMFRSAQARLIGDARGFLDRTRDPRRFASELNRLAGFFVGELHAHHNIEDVHYFPLLAAKEPRLERGFALLDADHHAIDPELDRLTRQTQAVLRALASTDTAGTETAALLATLERFARLLDRHLTDEEEIVVPVVLHHGGAGL